jgi:hypothetical protein
MSLHHIGDEVTALRVLRDLLDPHGLIAIAELAEPMRVLPDDIDVGQPGLSDRLDGAEAKWFAEMREGLPESTPSSDLPSMLASAGFAVVGSRLARERLDAPLPDDARRLALGYLHRIRERRAERLDEEDLRALDVLIDADDPRSVKHRLDTFIAASRHIVIARAD